ncbi:MAG: hypothetical protein AAFN08_06555, partial [Cyanobacteria bacterium J06559_3]
MKDNRQTDFVCLAVESQASEMAGDTVPFWKSIHSSLQLYILVACPSSFRVSKAQITESLADLYPIVNLSDTMNKQADVAELVDALDLGSSALV